MPNDTSGGVSTTLYPVFLAFDAHAEGSLPVSIYKGLAEKYGIILVGSNESHNGLSQVEITTIVNNLLEEVKTRYPLDTNQIYVMGFSGGARVATLAAMLHPEIKSVIGCGAGFPQGNQPPIYHFDYFGIAGEADFNLREMMELDGMLDLLGFRHFLLTYKGNHSWPPARVMEKAIEWTLFNAMKDGRAGKKESRINESVEKLRKEADSLMKKGRLTEASITIELALNGLEGLAKDQDLHQKLIDIRANAIYKKQQEYHQMVLEREEKAQAELAGALFTKDKDWWVNRINGLKRVRPGDNPEDTLMNARLRAYLSLLCYSNVTAIMNQHNIPLAMKVNDIYRLADPDNTEPWYLGAVIQIQTGDTTGAIRQLSTAIEKGFNDRQRILQQPEFEKLQSRPDVFDLMKEIK
ncbi:MAG TPA: hypothetical protein PL087_05300 [Bacteroidales bacterium]|nr:hypothetical protein [Bacteroidales bacterium]